MQCRGEFDPLTPETSESSTLKKAIFFQRYPKDSYKTRMEEKQKEKDLTRWDWINDMSQQYQNPQHEIEQEDEGNSGHQTIGQFLKQKLLRSRKDYSGP